MTLCHWHNCKGQLEGIPVAFLRLNINLVKLEIENLCRPVVSSASSEPAVCDRLYA